GGHIAHPHADVGDEPGCPKHAINGATEGGEWREIVVWVLLGARSFLR
ncbi:MAG: hypothetical protein RI918_1463, partial [Pseudomonadota bacterium]